MAPPDGRVIPFSGRPHFPRPKPRGGPPGPIRHDSVWRPTVLVIDGDRERALRTATGLDQLDFRAIIADSPDRAFAYMRAIFVYGVILDPLGPDIDGFEVARAMAADPRLGLIGVVVTCDAEEARLVAAAIPEAEMVGKPADPNELAAAARRAVAATVNRPVPVPIVIGRAG